MSILHDAPALFTPSSVGRRKELMLLCGEILAAARRWIDFTDRSIGPVLDLAIRLWLARILFVSGFLKLTDWQNALYLSANEYPVAWLDPVTAAWIGVAVEVGGSILLAAGLFTRFAALAVATLALVIQYNYLELPDHLFWAILCGWLAVRGAGRLSLDHLLAKAAVSALPGARLVAGIFAATTRYVAPAYQLFIRLWMASIFWAAGQSKLSSWDLTLALFQDEYRVPLLPPELAAALATATEVSMPVLLVAGLFTRFSAIPLMIMTLVIQFTYLDRAEHFYWLMTLGLIALRGPGPLSLDHLGAMIAGRWFPQIDGRLGFDLAAAPRVLIIGAGFGGIAAARALARAPVQVTVIDRRNYHLFQPLLYQVATAGLSPADIATPIREILREQQNARVLLGRVTGVDTGGRAVLLGSMRVPYDYLILATGARHSYFGKEAWAELAPGLKKIDDATQIRRRILTAFEQAEACQDPVERAALLTFVIVGGGPTGVELAGAIAELARLGMEKDFRNFDPAAARVIIVESNERILAAFPAVLSAQAKASLHRLGVEIRNGARVEGIDAEGVLVSGERIAARTVLWAAGVAASPAAKWLGAETDRAGRVKVNADLTVPGLAHVFAVGDTAAMMTGTGGTVPGLAPAAKQSGAFAASMIRARVAGRTAPRRFVYRHLGSLATIGRKSAVADFGFVKLGGMIAWWLWGMVHVAFLVGARNRMAVMLDWLWAYLTFRRGIRLITGAEE